MKIEVDRDICIGAGNCVLAAPAVFDQDEDGIVELLTANPPPDQEAPVRQASLRCPSGAILAD